MELINNFYLHSLLSWRTNHWWRTLPFPPAGEEAPQHLLMFTNMLCKRTSSVCSEISRSTSSCGPGPGGPGRRRGPRPPSPRRPRGRLGCRCVRPGSRSEPRRTAARSSAASPGKTWRLGAAPAALRWPCLYARLKTEPQRHKTHKHTRLLTAQRFKGNVVGMFLGIYGFVHIFTDKFWNNFF